MRYFKGRSRYSKRRFLLAIEDIQQYLDALAYVKKKNKTKKYPKGCNDGIDLIKFYLDNHNAVYEIKLFN